MVRATISINGQETVVAEIDLKNDMVQVIEDGLADPATSITRVDRALMLHMARQ